MAVFTAMGTVTLGVSPQNEGLTLRAVITNKNGAAVTPDTTPTWVEEGLGTYQWAGNFTDPDHTTLPWRVRYEYFSAPSSWVYTGASTTIVAVVA